MAVRQKTQPGPASETLRRNIKRIREEQRLTFVELASRLEQIGRPIPVLGLRRIEMGERRVDVDDLLALAKTLGMPPVLLMLPLGREARVELLPGQEEETWDAVRWVSGRDRDQMADWRQSDVASQLWEAHDNTLVDWLESVQVALDAQKMGLPSDAVLERIEAKRADTGKSLRMIRARMRALRLTPPALPEEFASLEKHEDGQGPEANS